MKATFRKISVILALALMLSGVPFSAIADGGENSFSNEIAPVGENSVPIGISELALLEAYGFESEPNNSMGQANDIYEAPYNMYGQLVPGDNEDWYRYVPMTSGNIEFSLTNIPYGCDYDLEIWNISGSYILWSSANGSNLDEVINAAVDAYYSYYIRVRTFSPNRSTSHYTLNIYQQSNPYAAMNWSYFFSDHSISHITYGVGPRSTGQHYGIDVIKANGDITGTPIRSVTSGSITFAFIDSNTAGNGLAIRTDSIDPYTGQYLYASYMHMRDRPLITSGNVYSGNILGYVGDTGESTGAHLHFQVCNRGAYNPTNYSNAVNPLDFFPYISFTGDVSSNFSQTYQEEGEGAVNTLLDLRLVDYVGEELVLEWIHSYTEYKDIVDFILYFGIDDSTFEELAYQFNLYEIYDINEIQTEAASRR
jgi:hypothetical protein